MPYWRRLLQTDILPQKLSRRCLMVILLAIVVEGVDQHRHAQSGPAEGVGHGALVAEVGQRHQDAVDLVAVLLEQVGALLGVVQRFDGPAVRGVGRQMTGLDAVFFEDGEDLLAAGIAEVRGEETPVADDNT